MRMKRRGKPDRVFRAFQGFGKDMILDG